MEAVNNTHAYRLNRQIADKHFKSDHSVGKMTECHNGARPIPYECEYISSVITPNRPRRTRAARRDTRKPMVTRSTSSSASVEPATNSGEPDCIDRNLPISSSIRRFAH